jgi:hypothetical protein
MVEYLYGFGGCLWEVGDGSGDEEDEAMMRRAGEGEVSSVRSRSR